MVGHLAVRAMLLTAMPPFWSLPRFFWVGPGPVTRVCRLRIFLALLFGTGGQCVGHHFLMTVREFLWVDLAKVFLPFPFVPEFLLRSTQFARFVRLRGGSLCHSHVFPPFLSSPCKNLLSLSSPGSRRSQRMIMRMALWRSRPLFSSSLRQLTRQKEKCLHPLPQPATRPLPFLFNNDMCVVVEIVMERHVFLDVFLDSFFSIPFFLLAYILRRCPRWHYTRNFSGWPSFLSPPLCSWESAGE